MADALLSEAQAAAQLNLSTRTMKRKRRDGDGPEYVRVGVRRVAYDPSALADYKAARRFPHRAAELARLPETKLAGTS